MGTYQVTINTDADQSLYRRVLKALLRLRIKECESAMHNIYEHILSIDAEEAKEAKNDCKLYSKILWQKKK